LRSEGVCGEKAIFAKAEKLESEKAKTRKSEKGKRKKEKDDSFQRYTICIPLKTIVVS
jgi:hypothetical protein